MNISEAQINFKRDRNVFVKFWWERFLGVKIQTERKIRSFTEFGDPRVQLKGRVERVNRDQIIEFYEK